VLTHCNAGWLACVDWGTATSPIYQAHDAGVALHVWVDETRPRNQGAALTAYELGSHGVPHTIVVDNAGGHLMQNKLVDLVIVGTDRVAANGDVANKIGTYLKALAAHDNGVPFYARSIRPSTGRSRWPRGGPIEERSASEVREVAGATPRVPPCPRVDNATSAANPAFDHLARLVTGLLTERGSRPRRHAARTPAPREALCPTTGRARRAVIATASAMNAAGINVNKSGNVSVRCARGSRSGYLLTPTGIPYDRLAADDLTFVDASGAVSGGRVNPERRSRSR
jgi:methylthioribose-1-phosphate isomerase